MNHDAPVLALDVSGEMVDEIVHVVEI